jgi:hypothetical protein
MLGLLFNPEDGGNVFLRNISCLSWTTGKRTYIRALCQKSEGSVEIKQRLTKMGGRTTYRTVT